MKDEMHGNAAGQNTPECQHILPLLSEYLDAELSSDVCDRIAAHLRECRSCSSFIDSLRKSIALCKELECELTPDPLPESVKLHLRQVYQAAVQANAANKA